MKPRIHFRQPLARPLVVECPYCGVTKQFRKGYSFAYHKRYCRKRREVVQRALRRIYEERAFEEEWKRLVEEEETA